MIARISRKWDEFFFKPEPATAIALFRILFGLLVLASGLMLLPDRAIWFSDAGVLTARTLREVQSPGRIDLLLLIPDSALGAFFGVFLAAAFCLAIGLFTRLAGILVFLGLVSLHHRDPFILNSGDTLLRVTSFWLMFSAAGEALSVDRLVRIARGKGSKPALHSPWALRMIQIQLSLAYVATALWKSQGSAWRDGTAIYYTSNISAFQRFDVPLLFQSLPMIRVMTWGTLFVEFSLGLLIWVPALRYAVVAAGMALHLGIELTMNIPLFQWIMMSTLTTFIAPEDLSRMADRARGAIAARVPRALHAYYDGECVFCVRTRDVLRALDVAGRIEWVDFRATKDAIDRERAERELLLRSGDRWLGGFFAFRRMAWALPALWPIAPALYLPGMSAIGVRAYRWVSSHRRLLLGGGCDPESHRCKIHSR